MKPELVPHWKRVLRHAWSIRLIVVAGVLSAAEIVIPLFEDTIPRGWFAALSVIATIGAFVSRFVVQKDMRDE